jgi:toxin FitB
VSHLLDTNVLSELRRRAPDPRVTAWVDGQDPESLFLSVMTVYEIELGIRSVERRDPVQASSLRTWFTTRVLTEFADRVLPVDTPVAVRAVALSVPDRRPQSDGLIAATALVHGMPVVTWNIADFADVPGLAVLDPWRR